MEILERSKDKRSPKVQITTLVQLLKVWINFDNVAI